LRDRRRRHQRFPKPLLGAEQAGERAPRFCAGKKRSFMRLTAMSQSDFIRRADSQRPSSSRAQQVEIQRLTAH